MVLFLYSLDDTGAVRVEEEETESTHYRSGLDCSITSISSYVLAFDAHSYAPGA